MVKSWGKLFASMFSTWSVYVIAVLLVVGWFAIGTQYNIRRGNRALTWLQDGLKLLGEKSSLRWLGSSVVELKIQKAKEPFRQVEILIVLEPRDVPFLWWYQHARGRRDLLIVRGQLHRAPKFEFEALDRHSWSTRGIARQIQSGHWQPVPPLPPLPLAAYVSGEAPPPSALFDSLTPANCPLVRLAIRSGQPNLELQWRLDDIQKLPAYNLMGQLRNFSLRDS